MGLEGLFHTLWVWKGGKMEEKQSQASKERRRGKGLGHNLSWSCSQFVENSWKISKFKTGGEYNSKNYIGNPSPRNPSRTFMVTIKGGT